MSEDSIGRWQAVVPLLQVGNLPESLEYYVSVLGFEVEAAWPDDREPRWVHIQRDNTHFVLTIDLGTSDRPFIAEKGNGVVLYVVVDHIEAAYQELQERGAIVVQDMVQFGDRRQFSIGELNGYVLAFTEPFDL